MLKAVFFDMDGVVADTEPLHFVAYQKVMKESNISIPDSEAKEHIGISEETIWKKAKSGYGLKQDFADFEGKRRLYFFQELKNITASDRLLDLLEALKNADIKIGLVTSSGKDVANRIIERLDIDRYFDAVITGDDVKNKKPHKEPYALALSRLKIDRSECLAIEDSPQGIDSAKNAGIKCVALQCGLSREDLHAADFVVSSLAELSLKKFREIVEDAD